MAAVVEAQETRRRRNPANPGAGVGATRNREPDPTETAWAAFERHGWLDVEFKRLAGVIAEVQRLPRRAVLAWARRELDATDADPTLEQLEAMVELLVRRLAPVAVDLG